MKLLILFGPPAVGKMTVGKALSQITDFKLFHNHMSIELVRNFFEFGHPKFSGLDKDIRFSIFRAVAKSDLAGLIFTFVWALDSPADISYMEEILEIFKAENAEILFVELQADQSVRLIRNRGADRLAAKASKRNIESSEKNLLHSDANYQLNTNKGEFAHLNIFKIDNTHKSAEEVARLIKVHYSL